MNRRQLLERIRLLCWNTEDPFEFDTFASMPVRQLRAVVAILDNGGVELISQRVGPVDGHRPRAHCYLLDPLVIYLSQDPNARNPFTNRRITDQQRDAILRAHASVRNDLVQRQQRMRRLIGLGMIIGVGSLSALEGHASYGQYIAQMTNVYRRNIEPTISHAMDVLNPERRERRLIAEQRAAMEVIDMLLREVDEVVAADLALRRWDASGHAIPPRQVDVDNVVERALDLQRRLGQASQEISRARRIYPQSGRRPPPDE